MGSVFTVQCNLIGKVSSCISRVHIQTKQVPVPRVAKRMSFFLKGKKMENLGTDPSNSRMQSERSTV